MFEEIRMEFDYAIIGKVANIPIWGKGAGKTWFGICLQNMF